MDMEKKEEKDIMSIVSEDGSIEEVEVILAFEFKDNKKEYKKKRLKTEKEMVM